MKKMIRFHLFFIFHRQKMISDYLNTFDCYEFLIFSFLNYHVLSFGVPQHHLMNHIMRYLHQQRLNSESIIFNYSMLLVMPIEIYLVRKQYLIIFLNYQNSLPISYHLFLHFFPKVQMPRKHQTNFERSLLQLLEATVQLLIQF